MVTIDFIGTGVHVFSAITPTPGSYEVSVDGHSLSGWGGPSSHSDSQLLLGSITGLKMAPHTLSLVNSGMTGGVLNLAHVEVESLLADGRYGSPIALSHSCPSNRTLSSSLSTATFDDTNDGIRWGSGWVSAPGRSDFYNNTVQYVHPARLELLHRLTSTQLHGTPRCQYELFVRRYCHCNPRDFGNQDGVLYSHVRWTVRHL